MKSKRKTLIVDCPNRLDATSLYRAVGPISHLSKTADFDFEWLITNEGHWALYSCVEAVLYQRPYSSDHKIKLDVALKTGIKTWVDFDDNLLDIPPWNPASKQYTDDVKGNIVYMISAAHVVTVSTQQLAEEFNPLRAATGKPPCIVVPNAINELLFKRPKKLAPRNSAVVWRGSRTHDLDVMEFSNQIYKAVRDNKKMVFNFMGEPPPIFTSQLPTDNVVQVPVMDPLEYFDMMLTIAPALQIVPLHDCIFNRCKSNIAYLESAYAGAAAIVPDWPEWSKPGAIKYRSVEEFGELLQKCLDGEIDVRKHAHEAWDYASTCLTLEFVNKSRERILYDLLK